ncbi:MAG: potassium transporter TrkG [Coriobacteriales bacterium]
MLLRFHLKDVCTVGHYLGVILVVIGVLMLVPAAIAACFGETSEGMAYVFSSGFTAFFGALLCLLKAGRLDRRRSLLLCGFGWVLVGFFAAIPLYLSGCFDGFLGAFFDSVSALTSTGVTCLEDVEHLSYAQSTWRTLLSLAGGQAIIVSALYLGFFGDGGYSARDSTRSRRDALTAALRSTGQLIWFVMAGMVALGMAVLAVILVAGGMALPDALMNGLWLSGNAFSTGSYVPHNSSLIFYHSTALNGFVAVLMILGSLNFAIFALAISRGASDDARQTILRNSELRAYALWIFLLVVIVSIMLCREGVLTSLAGLFNHSTFMVVSAATTSGMQTVYPAQMGASFPDGALMLIMAAMFIGGCSCSTAGGLKIFRGLQVLRWFGVSVKRSLFPDSVRVTATYEHFGPRRAGSEGAQLAMVVTTLFIMAAAIGAAVFIAHGYGALDAICESISYVTNTGICVGQSASTMPPSLLLMAMLMMWAGRLEFVALIAAFASLVASLRPHRNVIPEGVDSSRKAQRRDNRRARLRRLRRALFLEGSGPKALLPLLLSLALAGGLLAGGAQQLALAEEAEAGFSLSQSYRSSSISELLGASSRMDGDKVRISGEVVGYAAKAGTGHSWLNIQDQGGKVISVYVRNSMAEKVTVFGGYGMQGDKVVVEGTYHQACPAHSGELEIHAASLAVRVAGYPVEHEANTSLGVTGVGLLAAAALILVLERLLRGRSRIRFLGLRL